MSPAAAVAASIAAATALFLAGAASAWRRAGAGRGVTWLNVAWFAAGMATLAAALAGPLDELAESLFSAHMAQHMLLMNVAAPFIVLASPLQAMLRALPAPLRVSAVAGLHGGTWRWLTGATAATLIQQAVLWSWHLPGAIALALESEAAHVAMHASLLVASLLFWTVALQPSARSRWRGIAMLVASAKVTGIVCIVMLIAPAVRYTAYADRALAFGLDARQDEIAAWGVMMVTMGIAYLAAAAALFVRALAPAAERRLGFSS